EFYDIVGAMHNNTIHVGGQRYFDKIGGFITRTLARPQKPENQ
nr:alpha/beta hydrolase [Nitrospinaceae bacterium]NIR54792.1 alpha/beta hydrolase [Nitrospinaceae bacterium]NIT82030.1 alpha/beta hydrolase [Nitrospinaceae bacterium]NIW05884.1 alpha/beta hydrolase [Nitrospinaceae bacterium]NIX34423.1 alpha/beta hydrolase [Nitrospinaceae bacterium]